jgi:hypothetical protein
MWLFWLIVQNLIHSWRHDVQIPIFSVCALAMAVALYVAAARGVDNIHTCYRAPVVQTNNCISRNPKVGDDRWLSVLSGECRQLTRAEEVPKRALLGFHINQLDFWHNGLNATILISRKSPSRIADNSISTPTCSYLAPEDQSRSLSGRYTVLNLIL